MGKKLRLCEYVKGIAYIKELREVEIDKENGIVEYVIGIPEELVREYGLKDGDNVEIFSCGEGIVIRKAKGKIELFGKPIDLQELEFVEDGAYIKVKGISEESGNKIP